MRAPGPPASVEQESRSASALPILLTVDETAALLRTSRKAVYAMIDRRLLPGVTRIGRRVLLRSADLLDFLDHNRAPSPQENRR
jgi:excisionase family DNA binding protein